MAKPKEHERISATKSAIIKGFSHPVKLSSARNALRVGFGVNAADKTSVRFNRGLVNKYNYGKGRKDGSSKPRLIHLGQATYAVKKANKGVFFLKNTNSPQKVYVHEFGKNKGIVVYVNANNNVARSFVPNDNIGKKIQELKERTKR